VGEGEGSEQGPRGAKGEEIDEEDLPLEEV